MAKWLGEIPQVRPGSYYLEIAPTSCTFAELIDEMIDEHRSSWL